MAWCILIVLKEPFRWFQVKGKTWAAPHDRAKEKGLGPSMLEGLHME